MPRTPFILAVLAAIGLASGWLGAQEGRVPFVYVAGYRPEISIFRLDTAGGKLTPVGKATNVGSQPSWAAFDPATKFLFAVDETDPGGERGEGSTRSPGLLPLGRGPGGCGCVSGQRASHARSSWTRP